MIVYFHQDFYREYSSDPAAESGRMEAIVETISPFVELVECEAASREAYLDGVHRALTATTADMIAVSAGFDHHRNDWGGLLHTADYQSMGQWVRETADRNGGSCYGILEGGYNHRVLGSNVLAFIRGLGGYQRKTFGKDS